jgi:para-aminobenzoate synthetase / 4-amino-4-deoxychorismate lyase
VPDASQGVFETLLVRDGRVQALPRHLDRMATSIERLYGLALPDRLADTVRRRAAGCSGAHRLRVDAIPASGGLSVSVETTVLSPRPRRFTCVPVTIAGGHGPHKWRDREALAGGPGVPLVVDEDGSVLEAAWANVWLLEERRLSTPPADGRLLAGVTRARLFELAPALGLEAGERPISLAQLRASGLLLSSSLSLVAAATLDAEPAPDDRLVEAIREALDSGDWDDPAPC